MRSTGLAGRIRERRILTAAIQEAVEGRPCAVLVHGEAGVGKTRLIEAVCEEAAGDGAVVLWGRCVRFGAVDAPYVPLIGALQGWVESTEREELSRVLEMVPAAGDLLPSLGGQTSDNVVRLLAVVDALVMTIASHQPTVLVVDDVQWADLASRDALAYLVAGFRSQRLVVLTTYRDEELSAGHPMHSWLADLRRLPSVTDVQLGRLSRAETEQQLSLLLGGRPQGRVVADVMERSDGNPYFSELLVQGVSLTADDLPVDLPTELTEALLAAWHGLSASAREVMRVLAVAGRPASIDDLRKVSAVSGTKPATLTGALTEATNSGICVAQGADMCWFRHPLLAEVLYATFVPGEAGPVHAAWAKRLRSRSSTGLDEVRRQGDLALHYEAAHDFKACLQASLRAADLARDIKASREEAVHLQRAASLWSVIHRGDTAVASDEASLLERVARASQLIGDGEAAFAAWSRALGVIDAQSDPRRASRLLTEWSSTTARIGRIHRSQTAEHRRAVELVQRFPDSAEYAQALANLADSEWWSGELNAAVTHGDEAVLVAERSGSNEALSCAYKVRAFTHPLDERSDSDTVEALRYARMTDDPELVCWAYVGRGNYLQDQGRVPEHVEMAAEFLQFALDVGALSMAVFAAGLLADGLLTLGRLPESNDVIREGLSLAGLPDSSAMVRLSAASLAVRQGNLEIAGMHIQRAQELIVALEENPGLGAPPVLAEYLLATGRPERALELLTRTMVAQFADPRIADEMLMWGARATADLTEHARDLRDSERARTAQAAFERLVALRGSLHPPPFEVFAPEDPVQSAMKALFTAESARSADDTTASAAWEDAVSRCDAAAMRWEEAIASWRMAQALLHERGGRAAVAVPLRSAHRVAVEVGAIPLQHQVETLAALGRILLEGPAAPSRTQPPAPFGSLTKRELEVLSHLVAGRTYAEIASALFISEKTVSVHVSNLLHKTGTSTRHDVSALAVRLGQA